MERRTGLSTGNHTFDAQLDALAHIQRRKLLIALLRHDSADDATVDITADEGSTQLVELTHVHLPKLADAGYIIWHRDSNEVSKGRNFATIRPLLELLDDNADALPSDWV